jgi:transcriptional regulator with XRE-family HTH domain
MNERGLRDSEVVKATGIPFSTFHGWVTGDVGAQLADRNLLKLAQFLNVTLEYLCFGVGSDEPAHISFENLTEDEAG